MGALEHCFIEIDKARPFFIMLSGERYGWVPPTYRTRDLPQYDWLKTFPHGHVQQYITLVDHSNGDLLWLPL